MTLQGTRCRLRAWRPSDAAALVRHANNEKIARQLRDRFPHPYTHEHARQFLTFASGPDADGSIFAIEVDGEAAGSIGYVRGSDVERYSAEVGYWLSESCWGRGITTDALVMLTDHLFRDLHMLRLYALPFAENLASARVLEKAGYTKEALLRCSAVKNGKVRDQLLYARINEKWAGEGKR